jgi:hypothetical protein
MVMVQCIRLLLSSNEQLDIAREKENIEIAYTDCNPIAIPCGDVPAIIRALQRMTDPNFIEVKECSDI